MYTPMLVRHRILLFLGASYLLGHLNAAVQADLGGVEKPTQPNVVFVITDDQGYGDLSCHGNPVLQTPALDLLYSQSLRLTDYHVNPTCSPTRGALHSGHYANRAGTWSTTMGRSLLREGEMTLGRVFADSGYATGLFGKWHLGDNYPFRPEDRGFQEVVRHGGGGVGQTPDYWDNTYFNDTYFHNGAATQYQGYCTDVFFAEAKRFIRDCKSRERPFLAYISTNAPHSPWHCPEAYWKPYMKMGLAKKEAIFLGMIANIEENVGALRKWLAEEGLQENTLFIFTTDNGTAAGDAVFNAGMRGKKTSAYDGGHRVPFFFHWPAGRLNQGRDIDNLTAHVDILPTLIELCGLQSPSNYQFDGRSLVPLLYALPVSWPERALITDSQRVDYPIKWRSSAVMTERWRLIRGDELYDIVKDPGQRNDLSRNFPGVVETLRSEYENWWNRLAPGFEELARIRLGSDQENPSHLTCHDWFSNNRGIPWHQGYIRSAYPQPGYWAVRVERPGQYEIVLRRWPRELDRPIVAGLEPGDAVAGDRAFREVPGRALPVTTAGLRIGSAQEEKAVRSGDTNVRFRVDLTAGDYELHGYFKLDTDEDIYKTIGAYYVSVERL